MPGWSGGGVYSFFNTTTTIARSTISGNVSNDVGGGIRSLGNMTITNSTISGNRSTGWHGGRDLPDRRQRDDHQLDDRQQYRSRLGAFHVLHRPVRRRVRADADADQHDHHRQPVVRLRAASPQARLGNVVSGGNNVVQDDSCNPAASDQIIGDALIGPLGGNGGPTQTHALLPGSPAIDTAADAACPAIDQRGVTRPQGPHCDVGAFEVQVP